MALITPSGCAGTRGQQTAGAYVDDSAITTKEKARMIDNRSVDAAAISVETLNGTVMLSGFATKSPFGPDFPIPTLRARRFP